MLKPDTKQAQHKRIGAITRLIGSFLNFFNAMIYPSIDLRIRALQHVAGDE